MSLANSEPDIDRVERRNRQQLDPPLVQALQSQIRSSARLHLFLVAVPSGAACPPLALQCTINTSFDKTRVLKPRAALFLQLRASQGPWEPRYALWVLHRPSNVAAAGPGTSKRSMLPLFDLLLAIGLSSSVLASLDIGFAGVAATKETLRHCGSCTEQRSFVKCT